MDLPRCKNSDFEWRSSGLFLVGGRKILTSEFSGTQHYINLHVQLNLQADALKLGCLNELYVRDVHQNQFKAQTQSLAA